MDDLTHMEIQELLGVYALDAVDKETAALVESHLETCVRCAAEVAQHHEVAGLLANTGGDSPAELWDGIASHLDGSTPPSWEILSSRLETGADRSALMAAAGSAPTEESGHSEQSNVIPITGRPKKQWAVRVAGAAAAVAAVVALVLGIQVNHLNHQVNAAASLSAAERSALNAPSTKQIHLTSSTGVGKATIILTNSGTGFVEAQGLAALSDKMTYQLWGVVGGKTISLGLLGSNPSNVPFSVAGAGSVNAFAITAEHAGGVVQSSNKPVVAGEVDA
jgi:anti-sigma factor RsiW